MLLIIKAKIIIFTNIIFFITLYSKILSVCVEPSGTKVILKNNNQDLQFKLLNTGIEANFKLESNSKNINLEKLSKGIYIIKIRDLINNISESIKIIKN